MDWNELFLQAGIAMANAMIAEQRNALNEELRKYRESLQVGDLSASVRNAPHEAGAVIVEGSVAPVIEDESRLLEQKTDVDCAALPPEDTFPLLKAYIDRYPAWPIVVDGSIEQKVSA